MSKRTHFISAQDVLVLRGNKLFGDAGSFGESMVPPWPSVAAGAYRSALLALRGADFADYGAGEVEDPELGTPKRPGSFTLQRFHLARRRADGQAEPVFPLPADCSLNRAEDGTPSIRRVQPRAIPRAIASSNALPMHGVLPEPERGKPESGWWLTARGLQRYLKGDAPDVDDLLPTNALWKVDTRVGVGLDHQRRRADDGRLFSVQTVALSASGTAPGDGDVGFVTEIAGCALPEELPLRLGGDGRAAHAQATRVEWPEPDFEHIAQSGRARLMLTSPGIFAEGWLPTGAVQEGGQWRFALDGVRARIAAASVARAGVVSGWDLAGRAPKPAERAAAAGTVYWLDELEANPDRLRKLSERGLWTEGDYADKQRRAEGFNRFLWAAWP